MIQRYHIYMEVGQILSDPDGEYVRYADIEPLLPRWVACSERLPIPGIYRVVYDGDIHFAERSCFGKWVDMPSRWEFNPTHWLDLELPPLPPEPTQ